MIVSRFYKTFIKQNIACCMCPCCLMFFVTFLCTNPGGFELTIGFFSLKYQFVMFYHFLFLSLTLFCFLKLTQRYFKHLSAFINIELACGMWFISFPECHSLWHQHSARAHAEGQGRERRPHCQCRLYRKWVFLRFCQSSMNIQK